MRRLTLWIGGIIVAVGVAVLGVFGWIVGQPGPTAFAKGSPVDLAQYKGPSPVGVPTELAGADPLTRGKYLTEAADCEACHTIKGGTPFAGGRAFKLPFGTLYTPNITPDPETGIGKWSDADFLKAVHKGIAPGGTRLYPAFPYASYTMLTDEDVLAIKAYLFSLPPVKQETPPNTFSFPYNQRWLMAFWGAFFNSDKRFRPIPEQSPQWNRGAYLVEALAHCGECHSPRNLMQAMNTRQKFAGGEAEGWTAYNITQDRVSGIGTWSAEDLAGYLARGHALGRGTASGPMREAVELSLSKLSPRDITAMVAYLQTVPAIRSSQLPEMAGPAPAAHKQGPADNPMGKRLFEGNCVSCHAWNGQGALVEEAQLTGNRAVNDVTATNVAQMILSGVGTSTSGRPYMPSFAAAYTDREVASVANYVTARFGSKPSSITPEEVGKLRAQN
ncbi:cytochrome c [Sphingomonas sp. PR090111-T3T-6A]|uniref:cytochrome c n=1 Tax=Sphingomonas sp. PR090111-T3T-6A TaxID=685778 RepID=UPI000370778D|nr:cytochrome c [Sphingomonas sp. PR090111-T3T-6A]